MGKSSFSQPNKLNRLQIIHFPGFCASLSYTFRKLLEVWENTNLIISTLTLYFTSPLRPALLHFLSILCEYWAESDPVANICACLKDINHQQYSFNQIPINTFMRYMVFQLRRIQRETVWFNICFRCQSHHDFLLRKANIRHLINTLCKFNNMNFHSWVHVSFNLSAGFQPYFCTENDRLPRRSFPRTFKPASFFM